MGVSKVVYGGKTLIDLTGDTVTEDKLLKGATAHGKDGEVVTGVCTFDVDSNDATVAVAEVLKGKTAYARGQKLVVTAVYSADVEKAKVTFCGDYSVYSKPCGITDRSGFSVSGGTFSWAESVKEYKFMNNATYNWIAIGS